VPSSSTPAYLLLSSHAAPVYIHTLSLHDALPISDRSRARRCVEACVYGTLDFVGYPRFPAPVEFIAAVIAYYVHPVNIQTEQEKIGRAVQQECRDRSRMPSSA